MKKMGRLRTGAENRKKKGQTGKRWRRIVAFVLMLAMVLTSAPEAMYAADLGNQTAGPEDVLDNADSSGQQKGEGASGALSEALQESVGQSGKVTVPEPQGEALDGAEQESAENPAKGTAPDSADGLAGQPGTGAMREQADWSGNADEISLGFYKAVYQDKEQKDIRIDGKEGNLDLAAVPVETTDSAELSVLFRLIKEKADWQVKGGDHFSFTLPSEYLTAEDTAAPVELFNRDAADVELSTDVPIGTYEIKNQVVTVTFSEALESEETTYLSAILPITVRIRTENLLQEQSVEAAVPWGGNGDLAIVLPGLPKETVSEEKPSQGPEEVTGLQKGEKQNEGAESGKDAKQEEDTEPDEDIGMRIRAFFRNIFGTPVSREVTLPADAMVTKHTFKSDVLPEGFNNIKISVYSNKDGYSAGIPDKGVGFKFAVTMDDDYLYEWSEKLMKYPDFPRQNAGEEDEEFQTRFREWLKVNAPSLTWQFDKGEHFRNVTQPAQDVLDSVGKVIGSFQIEKGILTVTMDPVNYFKEAVYMAFSYIVNLDENALTADPEEVVVDDKGELILQTKGTAGGGGGTVEDPKYTVGKEAPERVTDAYYEYKVTVTANKDETLNGKYLTDVIPEGLEVTDFFIAIDGGSEQSIDKVHYLDMGNVKYQFEELLEDKTNAIKTATARFRVELNKTAYEELIRAGSKSWEFKNTAKLMDAENTKALGTSEEVSTTLTQNFLKKSGSAANMEETRFSWTVKLDTYLPHMDYGYLVDTLSWTDHTYDFEEGIVITEGENTHTIKNVQKLEGENLPTWGSLTASKLKELMGDNKIDPETPFYYIYSEAGAAADPFTTGGKVQQAVLVIPYNTPYTLQGSEKNKSVSIQYYTDLNRHNLSAEEYWEVIRAKGEHTPAYTPTIGNKVNLLWENKTAEGPGPGAVTNDQVNFGKDVTGDIGTITKRGISYDEKTRELSWGIDVNKLGVSLKNIVIEDKLAKGAYDLTNLEINYYLYNSGNGKTSQLKENGVLEKATGEADAKKKTPSYTLETDGAGNHVLKIYLGDLMSDANGYEFYTLNFKLPLTDPAVLSVQEKNSSENNKAKNTVIMTTGPDNDRKQVDSTGEMKIPNTLIEKKAVGQYNYFAHTLKWAVTVNPNHVPIKGAEVTDTLETGFTLESLDKVTKIEKNGTASEVTAISNTGAPEKPVWVLGDIGTDSYVLEFTAAADSGWRKSSLTATPGCNMSVIVPNTVQLDGTVYCEADGSVKKEITNAKATANHVIAKKPVSKSGVYDEKNGSIFWTVVVNGSQYDISGLSLVEILTDPDEAAIHELDVDSVKVQEITNAGLQDAEVTKEAGVFSGVTKDGFKYKFNSLPSAGKNEKTYQITFTTYLTKEAEDTPAITNQVYLNNDNGDTQEESEVSDGGFHGGFDFDNNAGAKGRPRITIHKVSKNSTDETGGDASLALSDAAFELTAYKCEVTGTKLEVKSPVQKYDKGDASSNEMGDIIYGNIKGATPAVTTGDKPDLVYVLIETAAPAGYKTDSEPKFIYFGKDCKDITEITYGGATYDAESLQKLSDNFLNSTAAYTNTPINTPFSFTKKEVQKLNQDGSVQSYKAVGNGEVKFELKPKDTTLAGKLKARYLTADASGRIDVGALNLDPGTYILTEVKSNTNMSAGGTVELEVKWDEGTKKYTYTFHNAKNGISISETDPTVLQDDLTRGTFSFTKYVKYADDSAAPSAPNENVEVLPGAKFKLKGKDNATSTVIEIEKISDAKTGKVSFDNLPAGTYEIYETAVPDGYKPLTDSSGGDKVYTLIAEEKDDESKLLWTEEDGTKHYAKKITMTATPANKAASPSDTDKVIHNTPIKGTITLTKQSKDESLTWLNGSTLEGAEFGLYRKIGGAVSTAPIYTATSGSDGKVSFENVEFGDYVLKETKAPAGFICPEDVLKTITKADLKSKISAAGASDPAFTYDVGILENQLHKANVTLTKTNQDNEKLSGIEFDFYRRGRVDITDETGIGFVPEPGVTVKSFKEYVPVGGTTGIVTTNADGIISLPNLPYGEYLMVEKTGAGTNLQEGYQSETILISVALDKTEIFEREQTDDIADLKNVATPATDADWNADKHWKKLEQPVSANEHEAAATVVNQLKYGYVQLNKVSGNEDGTGTLVSTGNPVAGARFEIRQSGSDQVYLTLRTNTAGRFEHDADGFYTDADNTGVKKHLFYGDYTITEVGTPDGYVKDGTAYSFSIKEGETGGVTYGGHEGTAWISNLPAKVTYVKKDGEAPDQSVSCFCNKIDRAPVILKKTDLEEATKVLSGAQFIVYDAAAGDDSRPVASLLEQAGVKGSYQLSGTQTGTTAFIAKDVNKNNEDYLVQAGDSLQLLKGKYYVKEFRAPEGYTLNTEAISFEVSGSKVLVGGKEAADGLVMTDRETDPKLYKKDQYGRPVADARLSLTGHFAEGAAEETKTLRSNTDGLLKAETTSGTLEDLTGLLAAGEDYVLEETAAPAGYRPLLSKVRFSLDAEGKFTACELEDALTGTQAEEVFSLSDDNLTLTLTDARRLAGAELTKQKKGDAGTPIAGVDFTLYKVNGEIDTAENGENDDTKIYDGITTDTAGKWKSADVAAAVQNTDTGLPLMEGLAVGTYYFRETNELPDYHRTDAPVGSFTVEDSDFESINELSITKPVTVENDPFAAELSLTKYDAADNTGIEGAVFELSRDEGAHPESPIWGEPVRLTTGKDGVLSASIPKTGAYRLKEVSAEGYDVQTEGNSDEFTVVFRVNNDDYGKTLTLKKDDPSLTEFDLQAGNVRTEESLLTEAGIKNERLPGSLTLQKVDAAEPDKSLNGAEFAIYKKTKDSWDKETEKELVMAGTTGKSYIYGDGTNHGEAQGAEGILSVRNLPWGSYWVVEVTPPEGYVITQAPLGFTVQAAALEHSWVSGGTQDAVSNDRSSLTLRKEDLLGNALAGGEFTLEEQTAADTWKTIWKSTAADGSAAPADSWIISGLLTGGRAYRLTETKAPAGYKKPQKQVLFGLAKDGTVTITEDADTAGVTADKKGILMKDEPIRAGIEKISSRKGADGNDLELTGWIFKVTADRGSFADPEITEIAGITPKNVNSVLKGSLTGDGRTVYTLTETKAPAGYELAQPVTFTVADNGQITIVDDGGGIAQAAGDTKESIQIKDEPVEISFVKKDEDGGSLEDVEFLLRGTFADGTHATDYDGQAEGIVFTSGREAYQVKAQLIAGNTYTLEETREADGFCRLQKPVLFTVAEDGTVAFAEEGNPEGAAAILDGGICLTVRNEHTRFYIDKVSSEKGTDGKAGRVDGAVLFVADKKDSEKPVQLNGRELLWTTDAAEGPGHEITGLPAGTYWLKEMTTPYGYITAEPMEFELTDDNRIQTKTGGGVSVIAGETPYDLLTMTDTLIYGSVKLTKQGEDASIRLSGVVFSLYKQNGLSDDILIAEGLTTGPEGIWESAVSNILNQETMKALSEGLTAGTYYFRETKTNEDYLLNDKDKLGIFTIDGSSHAADAWLPVRPQEVTVANQPFSTSVALTKVDLTDGTKLAGAEFTIERLEGEDSEGTKEWVLVNTAETDTDGAVTFTVGRKGTYRLTETKTALGYQQEAGRPFMGQFTVDHTDVFQNKTLKLSSDMSQEVRKTYHLTTENVLWHEDGDVANERMPGLLMLEKADAADGKALDGVTFTLYKKEEASGLFGRLKEFLTGSTYQKLESEEWSKDSGESGALTIRGLEWGDYYIQESSTLDGYVLEDTRYDFSIGRVNREIVLEVDKGSIKNKKTRIYFYKYGKRMEECADGTLEHVPDKDYAEPLGGAEFTLYADEKLQNAVQSAQSGADGLTEFIGLTKGHTYYIKETKVPDGFKPNDTVYTAVLDEKGQYAGMKDANGRELEGLRVVNDQYRTTIRIKKVSEQDPDMVLPGSAYGLYKKTADLPVQNRARMLQRAAGTMQTTAATMQRTMPEDNQVGDVWTLIATATTDKEGVLTFEGILMDTEYSIRELAAPEGSQVSEAPITIFFELNDKGEAVMTRFDDGSGTAGIDPDTGEIVWYEPPIMVGFSKKDGSGRLLAGAKLELQDMEGSVLDTWTSSEEPYVICGDKMDGRLKAGEQYRLVEREAPAGYVPAEPVVFTVEAKKTAANEEFIQPVEMTDTLIRFRVSKLAQETGLPLAGAKLSIREPGGEERIAVTVPGETLSWTTEAEAKTVEGLAAGTYLLREDEAPAGYDKAMDITFSLDQYGNVSIDGKAVQDQTIIMEDAKKKDEPAAEPAEKPTTKPTAGSKEKQDQPKTGDSAPMLPFTAAMLLAAGIMIRIYRRKKNHK